MLEDDLRGAVAARTAVVVAGAGVSVAASGGARFASWRGLLEHGIGRGEQVGRVPDGWADVQRAQLDLGDIESWLAVAEQVTQRLGGREGGEFARWLRETIGSLSVDEGGGSLLQALVDLDVVVCTTNYDGLIEDVAGVAPVTWREGARAQRVLRRDESGIVHLHGYWGDPLSVVLGVRSYESVLNSPSAQAMLRALATMRSLVLVGFGAGLADPNFAALRAWLAKTWSGSEYRHFRLVRAAERDAVLEEHGEEERIVPIVYGDSHDELAAFVRDVAARSAPAPSRRPQRPEEAGSLPAPRPFFGREDLLDQLVEAVLDADPAPVPILGPPGIGKSALALACAHDHRVASRFGARRIWLRCDSDASADELTADIALALGVVGTDQPREAAVAELAAAPTLLMLDNAETPWESDLNGTEELLARLADIPELALVCSIRGAQRPLGPRWVDSIAVPPLPSGPAQQVFLAAAGDRFATDPVLPVLLADLDGMPIAIELLGRLAQPESSLEPVRRRWERRRTDLLQAGTDPDRHLSVAVSFDLSIQNPRLGDAARRLLSLLALLPDGVLADDLEAIFAGGEDAAAELRAVGLAFDESPRLRVLKPIRDHVAAHYPVTAADAARAIAYFVELAQAHAPAIGTEGGAAAAATLTAEGANLRWAITRALHDETPVDAIDAALALTELGRFSGVPVEDLLILAQQRASEIGSTAREALGLFNLGLIRRAEQAPARECFERALELYTQLGDPKGEANCILRLGELAMLRSDHQAARERFEQALPRYQEAGDALGHANCILVLGTAALHTRDYTRARECFDNALTLYREIDEVIGEANSLKGLANLALAKGDHAAATERIERAMPLYRRAGDLLGEANCVRSLGEIALERSQTASATQCFERALPLYRRLGSVLGEATCISRLGQIAVTESDSNRARQRFEQALSLFESLPEPYSVGHTQVRLAHLSPPAERRERLAAAREAWLSIGRDDLVAALAGEAGATGT